MKISIILGIVAAAAILIGGPALGADELGGLCLAVVAAAPSRRSITWGQKNEPMKTFNNVGASQTAYSAIPRYPRTILGFHLELGGTTFTKALVSRIEIFLGETSIWGPMSGTDLQMVERYIGGEKESGVDAAADPYWLTVDFTNPNVKEIGGEQIGGLDLVGLPDGPLRMEVDIGAATAPTLKGEVIWSQPQGSSDLAGLMRKLIKRTFATQPAGDWFPEIDMRGAIMLRQFVKGTVYNNAVATAGTAANNGTANTGNGAASATVGSLTPAGRYKAVCVEPGANVGTFVVFDPKGKQDGVVVTGAGAVTLPSGLVVTIADGATDFIVGDTFFFDVLPNNTDGNINLAEVKKNEDIWWFKRSRAARHLEQKYGRTPMAGLEVLDYLLMNHADSVIDTANALVLDYRFNLTAQDTPSIVHEVLATPTFNAK